MPSGKGTYGKKVGRPPAKKKTPAKRIVQNMAIDPVTGKRRPMTEAEKMRRARKIKNMTNNQKKKMPRPMNPSNKRPMTAKEKAALMAAMKAKPSTMRKKKK